MSRHDDRRLADILAAADAIADHLQRGDLDEESDIPWIDVAGMRDQLAHRYFDTAHSIVRATVTEDLPPLVAAVNRLLKRVGG